MRKIIALAGLSVALPVAVAAAQELPGWPTGAACSPGDDACPAFESEYRGRVSGVWSTLPPNIRGKCVSETEPIEKSYRLLYDCLANAMQTHIKNQARHPEDGEVVHMTPHARTPEPAPATAPPTVSQPSPPAAAEPDAPAPSGPAPTPPHEARQPAQTDVAPPATQDAAPPSAAQPAPPTATEPAPPGTAPAPRQ